MSILNVAIETDRVLVAVDSLAVAADGQRQAISKLFFVAHSHLVIGMRGTAGVLGYFSLALISGLLPTIEACALDGPALLLKATEDAASELESQGDVYRGEKEQAFVAGWSHERGRFEGVFLMAQRGGHGWVDKRVGPGELWATPDEDLVGVVYEGARTMLEIPPVQLHWMLQHRPDDATGGDLILAELTRSEITIRNFGAIVPSGITHATS